ncbi:hypothetical protein BpHYR1_021234 [Brachionus plicatilis]|uniref:Uncharacterized protein n=1 Tax=Brachionus plicatilis TaxID=10195 RepID=A0A3M7P1Z9_BRAPC|nr:hypothetical protein BpHYR1_021234 [Brachionus plicatilis]
MMPVINTVLLQYLEFMNSIITIKSGVEPWFRVSDIFVNQVFQEAYSHLKEIGMLEEKKLVLFFGNMNNLDPICLLKKKTEIISVFFIQTDGPKDRSFKRSGPVFPGPPLNTSFNTDFFTAMRKGSVSVTT